MALATSLPTAILVSTGTNKRTWRVVTYAYTTATIYLCTESIKEEVYEYVALTKTLAQTTADAASQDGLPDGAVASYLASEDNRTIGSYKLTKTITYAAVLTVGPVE
jgi:hypothetical protein